MNTKPTATTEETVTPKLYKETVSNLTTALASITALLVDNTRALDELTKKHEALTQERDVLLQTATNKDDKKPYTLQDISNALTVVFDRRTRNHVHRFIPNDVYNSDLFDYILEKMVFRVSDLKFDHIVCYNQDSDLYRQLAYKLNCKFTEVYNSCLSDTNKVLVMGSLNPLKLSEDERVLVVTFGLVKGNTIAQLSKAVTDAGGVVAGEFSFLTLVGCSQKALDHNSLLYFGVGVRSATLDSGLHYMDA
jgi:adenine/guanine phosphoribosyltransferase-like PRPP-binding protein